MSAPLYRSALATLTDLYELTMAAGYRTLGRADDEAVFHLFFRRHPFEGGFTIAAGLEAAADFLEGFRFEQAELDHLATLTGRDGAPLFEDEFLRWLGDLRLRLDVDAIPEGTVVFPHEPLVRVRGPLAQAQLVESALLNLVNFPTLVATQAAHLVEAAGGKPVVEFGLRRAQGPDGALTASRAAYLGGGTATSNVLAGRLYGIPVVGTHAHSWVLAFESEQEAFDAYARAQPNNATLLVDTYDTLVGVERAIVTGRRLREEGHDLAGIRLDSGDLAYLSAEARRRLDAAGFADTTIVASNDLDAETIASLRTQGSRIDVWGVGTKLVTAFEQPALGGIYKLAAVRPPGGAWRTPVKVSDDPAKTSIPGILGVRRYYDAHGIARADMLHDELEADDVELLVVDPTAPHRRRAIEADWRSRELLVPVFRRGERVWQPPSLDDVRAHARAELDTFHPGIRRRLNPHRYPAGIEGGLHRRREALIEAALASDQVIA